MNSKTTLLLAALLAGLVMGYYGLRRQAPAESSASTTPSAKTETSVTRDLLSDSLGNVVKVATKRGNDEWTFEKKAPADGGPAAWHMTKPMEAKVLPQEVDRIAREAGKIQYEISYKPGEGAISAAEAGLSPPASTITLTDDSGKSATIEIGKPVSENETYARKLGDETIVVAKSNLRKLLKAKPLEYRDLQLWNFAAENVTRAEACETPASEAQPVCYSFVRDGARWMMEQPVSAKATGKVDEMLKAISRLRVSQWQDDDASKLKVYGLDPGALQISIKVEETVPAQQKDVEETKTDAAAAEEPPPAPPEKRIKQYKLQVADRGPIGEDTKVFVRSGDDNAVATIFKSAADKFKPVMSEWREMQVASTDVTKATRLELNVGGKSTILVQREGQWIFEADGATAEAHAVSELLAGIKGLKAVSFVEGPGAGPAPSFDSPQADIRLTIPGVDGVERITLGGYTDPAKKFLVYVRRGDSGPIAKVKASDVLALTQPPAALRDRTVFNFTPDDLTRVVITRANEFAAGNRQDFTLEKKSGVWAMTSPTTAPVRTEAITNLTASLGSLKAESIAAESGEATAFGLHEPSATLALSIAEPAAEGTASGASGASKTMQLALAEHDGKIYAKRGDGGPIYEVNKAFFDQLRAEFRSSEAFEFEPKDVERVTSKSGEEVNSFARKAGKWVFESEPDLPMDSARIDKILTEVKALKSDRFASYSSNPIAPYDLEQPRFELSLTLNSQSQPGEHTITLRVSEKTVSYQSAASPPVPTDGAKPPAPQPATANFATLSGRDGVFLLGSDAVKKVFVPLEELEKK